MENWLEKYLLPCPFKALTGLDCPGCGFQRSVIALLKGYLTESFHLYPATIPILLLSMFLLLKIKILLDENGKITRALFAVVITVVTVSYAFKVVQGKL